MEDAIAKHHMIDSVNIPHGLDILCEFLAGMLEGFMCEYDH